MSLNEREGDQVYPLTTQISAVTFTAPPRPPRETHHSVIPLLSCILGLTLIFLLFVMGSSSAEFDLDLSVTEGHSSEQSGYEGDFVYFNLTVENTGTEDDVYSLEERDVPNELTVSFPNGSDTENLSPGEKSMVDVKVNIEDKSLVGTYLFNITATSEGNESVQDMIQLTVVVNQTFEIRASLMSSPPGNKADPGDTAVYIFEINNKGNGVDNITIEVPEKIDNETNVPLGWNVTADPGSVILDPDEAGEVDLEVEIGNDSKPETNIIELWFWYHNGTEKMVKDIIVIVNQTYNLNLSLESDLTGIYPGFSNETNLTILNTGSGWDYYSVKSSNVDGITAVIDPSLTNDIDSGENVSICLNISVRGGEEPGFETLWINVTSMESEEEGKEVVQSVKLTIEILDTFGVNLNKVEEVYLVEPTFDQSGTTSFQLTVRNEGTANDTFSFELTDNPLNNKFGHWITLSDNVSMRGGETDLATFELRVDPFHIDNNAISDWLYNDIEFRVYSEKARKNHVEIEDETTKSYLCHIVIEEYLRASLTSDIPGVVVMDPGEERTFNATLKNEGNGWENYTFVREGETRGTKRGGTSWYDFDISSVHLAPGEEANITVTFHPGEDALAGEYGLSFFAQSESLYTSDHHNFTLEITEWFGVKIDCPDPSWEGIQNENTNIELDFLLDVSNLGNAVDEFRIFVPNDEFAGEKSDWEVRFGGNTSGTLILDPFSRESITLSLTIDKTTDYGDYELMVWAESQGDTIKYSYTSLYINLTEALYGLKLEKLNTSVPLVNPVEEIEIEFTFRLTNTGNQEDTFTINVETPLQSGPYKGWRMEFEDKTENRVETLVVPTDLKGNTDLFLSKNSSVEITLYVEVALNADAGFYDEITISATSGTDTSDMEFLSFNLTVILPNIRVSEDPAEFYIVPASDILEGDSIDIYVTIFNDGTDETGEFYIWFYNGKRNSGNEVGGTQSQGLIGWEKVDNIPAGNSTQIKVIWEEIPAGENDIYAHADKPIKSGAGKTFIDNQFSEFGVVLEGNETDNGASINTAYRPPLMVLPDLIPDYVSFGSRKAGEDGVTVTVSVKNIGTAKAWRFMSYVHLSIEGESLVKKDTQTVSPPIDEEIEIGGSFLMNYSWDIPDEPGNLTVVVEIEKGDDELNSSNNILTSYVITEEDGGSNEEYSVDISTMRKTIKLMDINLYMISISIKNTGNVRDDYRITASGTYQGWTFSLLSPEVITLDPGEKIDYSAMLMRETTNDSESADIIIVIEVRSLTRPDVFDSVTIEGSVGSQDDDWVSFPDTSLTVAAVGSAGVVACFRRRYLL